MIYLVVGSLALAVLSWAWSFKLYFELWKWARQCQQAKIVISWKRRVVLNASILEWMLWTNLLDKDKDSNGRVIYTNGGTQVAIIKRIKPGRFRIWDAVKASKIRRRPAETDLQPGKWTAKDDTVVTRNK